MSLSGCSEKPIVKVVIPDSHDLGMGIRCDDLLKTCEPDTNRVQIDLGYLRTILQDLEDCTIARRKGTL